jgi:cytochrome c biogenesis protein CcmG, thiol:disulfide interchange protein DsbE
MRFIQKHRSILSLGLLILGAAWIAGTTLWVPVPAQAAIPVAREGFVAPDFELNSLSGEKIRMSQLAGKPVILNFWASWCPPCKSEMPAIQKMWEHYQAKGVVVLAINATYQDSTTAAADFVKNEGLSFPILLDSDGSTNHLYRVQALPTTYFIDKFGVIRKVVLGGPMSEALLTSQVSQLLEGKP